MPTEAELRAIATSVENLTARVQSMAESLEGEHQEGLKDDLFEIERLLAAAARRLGKVGTA